MHSLPLSVLIVSFCIISCSYVSTQYYDYKIDYSCITPNRKEGKCVNIRQCPVLLSLLGGGRPLPHRDIVFLQQSNCGFEGHDPLVCCPENVSIAPTYRPFHSNPETATTNHPFTPTNGDSSADSEVIDVSYHPRLRSLLPDDCGSLSDDNKIINGEDSGLFEFPWMVLIGYKSSRGGLSFRCGGSLINHRYVLTAAHCLLKGGEYEVVLVRLGEHDLSSDLDCEDYVCAPPIQDVEIEEVIIHPKYSRLKIDNDIGLIRLKQDAVYNEAVSPVCLPIGRLQQLKNLEGQKVTVTGWGTTAAGTSSRVLQKVTLPVVPFASCASLYNQMAKLTFNHLCAGGNDKDSCPGDSGGPLQTLSQQNGGTAYVQYAIVTAGHRRCGTKGWPGVYTKVGHYMQWILDTMRL